MMASATPVFIITFLILLNGVFVAAEFAIVAVPRTRIKRMAEAGSTIAAKVLVILNDPERRNRFITTAQVGITIASLGLGMYGEDVLAGWFVELLGGLGWLTEPLAHTLAIIIAVGMLTYMHVVIGEMIPKSMALQSSIKTISALAVPITIIEKIFSPIVWILNKASFAIMDMMGYDISNQQSRLFTPAELEYVVAQSSMEGELDEADRLFVENIFDMRDRTAEQVMTPRNRVVAISDRSDLSKILAVVCDTVKTRYPVYDKDIDQIVGILHIKDLIRFKSKNGKKKLDLQKMIRPTIFIAESLSLLATLQRFRLESIQMAVVVDEFGGTAGIVTLEDLIEEVVGEIQDEFDVEIAPIEEVSAGLIKVRGDVILDELNQHYDLGFEHEEAKTIGGLVMAELGKIPEGGEELEYAGVKIKVTEIGEHSVKRVELTLPQSEN